MKKVLVLGYFGYRSNQLDGQTIKTRNIMRLLQENIGPVDWFDTQDIRVRKVSLFKMFWKIGKCDTLIYIPAQANLKFFFPFIYLLSCVARVRIHYFIVGGWLYEMAGHLPLHRFMLKRICGIHSETNLLKENLTQGFGFGNVDVFPNFRFFDFEHEECRWHEGLRLVFMARIRKEKGLGAIFSLGDFIERKGLQDKIIIDFYGPLFIEDEDYFLKGVERYPFMNYRGLLSPEQIYRILQHYDALLLPTRYFTEGLPGSVVDAYISGIPVIVTKWQYADEFVQNNETGIIIPFNDGQAELNQAVCELLTDPEKLLDMKRKALRKSRDFSAETAWSLMKDLLDK